MITIDIATLFPDMCESVLSTSILGRARQAGFIKLAAHDIRGFSENKHRRVDDSPYGGGMGMVMEPRPIYNCYRYIGRLRESEPHVIFLSPRGKIFSQQDAERLSGMHNLLLICGHYEGIDQRVVDEIADEELSVGDFVLTGGELAALTVTDAICRLIPGVLPSEECYSQESHQNFLLEHPHYTRPPLWNGRPVPEVLLCGDHQKIALWRRQQSLKETFYRRLDMLQKAQLAPCDIQYISTLSENSSPENDFQQRIVEKDCL